MKHIKLYLLFTVCLFCFKGSAHITIAGYEDSLGPQEQVKLGDFISTMKNNNYSKVYYNVGLQAVVGENSDGGQIKFEMFN